MSLLDKLLINLKIISKIQENGKLNTTSPGQISLEEQNMFSSFFRTLSGDSREKTIAFLNQLVDEVAVESDNIIRSPYFDEFDETDVYQMNEHQSSVNDLRDLSAGLQNSKNGIVNLHATYKSDANASSRIEQIIRKITNQINKIEKILCHIQINDKNSGQGKRF